MPSSTRAPIAVVLEIGKRVTYASALDWPGWCRGARSQHDALSSLEVYGERYREVARRAGQAFPQSFNFEIAESVTGNSTTDFGVPGVHAVREVDPLEAAVGGRLAHLLEAAWELIEETGERAPAELRKGPRGGGRDTAKILAHVRDAEEEYSRRAGIREKDWRARRGMLAAALRKGGSSAGPWPLAYTARRTGYHVLDHLWEIEDRSQPA